jgi:hypothetical protein
MQIYSSTITETKKLQHESRSKWRGEAISQKKIQKALWLIWQKSLKKSSEYKPKIIDLELTERKIEC